MLLYLHIGFQTLAFVVMNMQFINPGPGPKQSVLVHKILGYISLLALVVGVGSSWLMASEHGEVGNFCLFFLSEKRREAEKRKQGGEDDQENKKEKRGFFSSLKFFFYSDEVFK